MHTLSSRPGLHFRFALLTLALAAAAACQKPEKKPTTLPSGDARLQLSVDETTLTLQRAGQTLLTFQKDSFQIGLVDSLDTTDSFDPFWMYGPSASTPAGLVWVTPESMKSGGSTGSTLTLNLAVAGGTASVLFKAEAPGRFSAHFSASTSGQSPIAYLRLKPAANPQQGFYGLGEWGDSVEHHGKLRPVQMEVNTGVEGATNEAHAPVPLLIGTDGWGLFVESKRPGIFDVGQTDPTKVDVIFGTAKDSAQGLMFHLFAADAMDVQKLYYDVTGYPGLPAPWAYGPLIWRDDNRVDAQAQTMEDIEHIRSLHLATSGIWFDRPYATGVETWDFNPARYPDPVTMFKALHDAGLRYGVWNAPYCGLPTSEDPAPKCLQEAQEGHYFPPLVGGSFNNWSQPIDFTNPDAYAWWQQSIRTYTDPLDAGGYGIEGFKLDYAEDVQLGLLGGRVQWLFHDGSDELTMHYGYTMLYHKVYREMLPAEGGLLLTRTGRWGDQVQGMIIWPGDLDANFLKEGDPLPDDNQLAVGGLPAAVIKGISLSASGFPFYASDTGGYKHSPPNKECFLRWTEANAIGSSMEVGDSSGTTPWEYADADHFNDPQLLQTYAKYALLHLRLFPYAWTYAKQIATTGRPLVRPFGLVYPGMKKHPNDQFLFGDSILSAPVVEEGKTSKHVILPPGIWYGWWDGAAHDGGAAGAEIDVAADLHTLPLFLAAGGIVPMLRENIETLSPVAAGSTIESFAKDTGVLVARVAPWAGTHPASVFTAYDGTALTYDASSGTVLKYAPSSVFNKGALFELIATAAPTSVSTDVGALPQQASLDALKAASEGWFHSAETGGTLWVKVPAAATITVH